MFFKNYRKGVVTAGKVRYTVKTMWREEIKMEQSKIERINELARKARLQPLSEEEAAEQKALRLEYAAACRASLRASLENGAYRQERTWQDHTSEAVDGRT